VMNPISGRVGLLDFSLIRSSISWGHPLPQALEHLPPEHGVRHASAASARYN
jgi:hypothetical protein